MQLKRGFEQSVCILALLSTQQKDVPLSSMAIHARLRGSQTYLRKLMRKLVVGGLVSSASGTKGGFKLARSPEKITLAQVVQVVEGDLESYPNTELFTTVFADFQPLATSGNNVIQKTFAKADALWMKALSQVTIYQLLCETFAMAKIPRVDWNQVSTSTPDQIELLVKKLKQGLKF